MNNGYQHYGVKFLFQLEKINLVLKHDSGTMYMQKEKKNKAKCTELKNKVILRQRLDLHYLRGPSICFIKGYLIFN